MSEKKKTMHDIPIEKVVFTTVAALIIWSIILAWTIPDLSGLGGFFLNVVPPIGAYLIISSVTNILRAIRDGD